MSPSALLLAVLVAPPTTEWTAPPGCPGLEEVLAEAHRQGATLDDASLELHGAIEPIEGGYALQLTIHTSSGTTHRAVRTDSCEALARAAGLMLAVALDPLRVPAPPPSAAEGSLEQEPAEPLRVEVPAEVPSEASLVVEPISAIEEPPSAADAAPAPRSALRGAAIASGVLGRGITPSIDGRIQLGVGLDARWVRAELLGFHAFAQPARFPERPEIGAEVLAWGGSVRAGPRWEGTWLEVACPVGVELAVVVGEGFGAAQTWRRAELRWGPVVAPGLRVRLGAQIALGADVELDVAIRRPAFALEPLGLVHRTPRLGARGGVRLEVRFLGVGGDQNRGSRRP